MGYSDAKRYSLKQIVIFLTIAFSLVTVISYAAVTIPNTFTSGTTISSSQVNANFAALKTAVDDNQTQISAVAAKVDGVKIFHPNVTFTFPGTGTSALQTTVVDVPIFTAASDGVLEFQYVVSDVNAIYATGASTEVLMSLTPVINSTPGTTVTTLNAPLGLLLQPPLNGNIAFNVTSGQVVAVRMTLATTPYCSGGRGGSPTCALSVYATARFTPGAVLQ